MNKPMNEVEILKAQLAELQAKLANRQGGKVSWKIGEAGGLVIRYPGYKYPTNLFLSQWDMLVQVLPELSEFVKNNRSKFSTKE